MQKVKNTSQWRAGVTWLKVLVLASVGAFPVLANFQTAGAAQLTSRKVTVSTSEAGATATHTFEFKVATTGNVGSIEIEYCDTPLGACVAPTGLDVDSAVLGTNTVNGGAGNFSIGTGDANTLQVTRTAASITSGQVVILQFTGITNPTTANETFYPRITTFSDNAYNTEVDAGTVAGSTAQQLTVSARVQERLDFCVGTTSVNDAVASPGANCAAISGNTVDLGIVDSTTTCVSGPSNTCEGDSGVNGIAMVRTNAFEGVVIDYFAEQETSYGGLKVPGATCAAGTVMGSGSTTDQCFNSAPTTQTAFTNGTEGFGMTISHVNDANAAAYVGANLVRDTNYDGDGTIGQGFAWDSSGATDRIASSAGSAIKVVENEALIMRFAATSSITTPTGQYSVVSTYIATPTF